MCLDTVSHNSLLLSMTQGLLSIIGGGGVIGPNKTVVVVMYSLQKLVSLMSPVPSEPLCSGCMES